MMEEQLYFKYWGKARKEDEEGASFHLLPYHCLDVAAVADTWWEASPPLQHLFIQSSGLSREKTKAWLLFFIALHDFGKLDMRFQLKAPETVKLVHPDFDSEMVAIDSSMTKTYDHGRVGFSLFYFDFKSKFEWDNEHPRWQAWQPWLAAVAGHHGVIRTSPETRTRVELSEQFADTHVIKHDRNARQSWVDALEALFLTPVSLSIQEIPPLFNPLLAGYCSVADWLGSNSEPGAFEFVAKPQSLDMYYQQRLSIAKAQLHNSGLIAGKQSYQGVRALLPKETGVTPRQLQLLVDKLPCEQGLILVEAPTGSGKTETALAYAWRLLADGLVDNIIFALPTQATANAMLKRLEAIAPLLFERQPNLVLAHGKAGFNMDFWQIKSNYQPNTQQGDEEAKVQCAQWLSSSRKRVFLGQIGVCTIDQVLISVLPVRHKFVRGFGIGKSILIVDEVHAYDSYMYGLLGEVLRHQRQMGGSAMLLSATLPHHQREMLAKTWDGVLADKSSESYPLITHISHRGAISPFTLEQKDLPEVRSVAVELMAKPGLLADDELIQQMLDAAAQGAQVVFICNLVDVAQALAKRLRAQTDLPVDLFHARFRFCDRQTIEQEVLVKYGKRGTRETGSILVATQVVEQSLDLDFDWMITQLCPVDLLFQRLGRLHRHLRPRPSGFEQPRCTVLAPDDEDYGYHGLIYGNTRVLWRTAQKLSQCNGEILFPSAYREWIESVYQEKAWGDEPEAVNRSYDEFLGKQMASQMEARTLVSSDIQAYEDQNEKIMALTRDGEMSLYVLPVLATPKGYSLLKGDDLHQTLEAWYKDEAINLNTVAVPKSWRDFLPEPQEGLVIMPLQNDGDDFIGSFNGMDVRYSKQYGLERESNK